MKKVPCLAVTVGHLTTTDDEVVYRIVLALNFLVSLLKENWQNALNSGQLPLWWQNGNKQVEDILGKKPQMKPGDTVALLDLLQLKHKERTSSTVYGPYSTAGASNFHQGRSISACDGVRKLGQIANAHPNSVLPPGS
ncbi:hypothetical protein Celaphus_00014999 [Cervus elaphus hippelaphus]|uniref:Uncharacterized protein n=1 Tax=Cervus elaphus hippelaphus TaxID=46360 RepID=A0A212D3G2_CEREH|nr:hypothetical protein Celaphus_00014999 [Cervus elaphus hippelaphus]